MKSALRNLQLSPRSAVPDHLQITRHLEQLIRTGVLKEGERLPPTMELVQAWGLNINRIQRAMEILTLQGLLQRFPRRGTFVTSQTVRPSIGIMVGPDLLLEQTHFSRIVTAAVRAEVKSNGLTPRIYDALQYSHSEEARRSRAELDYDLRHHRFTGFVALSGGVLDEPFKHCGSDIPHVIFSTGQPNCDVGFDYTHFIIEASRSLIQKGCKKLVYFGGEPYDSKSFRRETASAGLNPASQIEISCSDFLGKTVGPSLDRKAYESMSELNKIWRRKKYLPDGIIIPDDIAARGIALAILSKFGAENAPKIVILTTDGVDHFYGLPTTRYSISPADAAQKIMDRLKARIIAEPTPTQPDLIQGHINDTIDRSLLVS